MCFFSAGKLSQSLDAGRPGRSASGRNLSSSKEASKDIMDDLNDEGNQF
jgi:hypothetical protein